MILSRRLLIPTLALFALVLTGLLVFRYFTFKAQNLEEEARILDTMSRSFDSELENLRILALSLASEAANNPEIQEAFAARDRELLTTLTLPSYQRLQEYNVAQYQFHLPPATSFLRLHSLDQFGDDLSSFRATVLTANTEQRAVGGVEAGRGGLGVRGVVPVFYQGKHIGSVEFGIDVGRPLLEHLQGEVGGEWHILLTQETMSNALPEELAKLTEGPVPNLLVFASTQDQAFYSKTDSYIRALRGQSSTYQTVINKRTYAILSAPLHDYSGHVIGVLDIIHDRTDLVQMQNRRLLLGWFAGAFALTLAGIGMTLLTRRTLQPINALTAAASNIAAGDLSQEFNIRSKDEIGVLSTAFENMRTQLKNTIGGLEERVEARTLELARRTLELETVSQVARDITSVRNLDTLLNLAAKLIQERFGFYHVGIFIVDERNEYAVLRAASSVAAKTMLEQHHKLKVGEAGIVGYVASTGLPRLALDVGADAVHFKNPLLPKTRSEVGLPLRTQALTIGVLNIQAEETSAFDEENIKTLQLLADQLVSAIENAQLVARAETTLKELNATYQAQTRQAWQRTIQERSNTALEYDGFQVRPVPRFLPASLIRQLENGKAVVLNKSTASNNGHNHHGTNTLIVPLLVQNQVIGVIGLEQDDPAHVWAPEEIEIAEAAAARAAIALENARLLQDAQTRAARERTITDISSKIGNLVDLDNIIQTTVQELSRSMPDAEVAIQFHGKE